MDYREYPVPQVLQSHVRCIWHLQDPQPTDAVQTVYPDGHCEVIVHRSAPMQTWDAVRGWHQQSATVFAGQYRAAIRLRAAGPVDCIGIRLQAAASALFAGAALPTLKDRTVDLMQLQPAFAVDFNAAAHAPLPEALVALLEKQVHAQALDARIANAVRHLQACSGQMRMDTLAGTVAMSPRALQMHFLAQVGLSAKEFARIQRLQATLRDIEQSTQPLAALAATQGYADQAHATRELQQITGLTPARLRHALQTQPGSETTIALAAAFVRGYHRDTAALSTGNPATPALSTALPPDIRESP